MYDLNFFSLRKYPMVRLVAIVIVGILAGNVYCEKFGEHLLYPSYISLAFLVFSFFVLKNHSSKAFIKSIVLGMLVFLYFFLSTISELSVEIPNAQCTVHCGIVCDKAIKKGKSTRFSIVLNDFELNNSWRQHTVKAKIYTSKDSDLERKLKLGDWVVFKGNLNRIRNNGNPFEFDYMGYMGRKGYYYQAFIPDTLLLNFGYSGKMPLKRWASYLQTEISELILAEQFNDDIEALLMALLVGDKQYVSNEMQTSFQNSGAIHILAVSGLHVGVVFIMLNFLLGFLRRNKWLDFLRVAIIILLIWLYALITGLSPSVQRAALMFTLITIVKLVNRDVSFYNILAGTALILLVGKPLLLFNIGFQLSFIAVGGIVFFQPIIYNWFCFSNKLIDYFYKLFSVSVAAQITTVPLTLYYFHQFPTYFWLTNMLIMFPLFLLIFASVAFTVGYSISILRAFFGKVVSFLAALINQSVNFVDNLPLSVIENISVNPFVVLLLYLLILTLTSWLLRKKPLYLTLSILLILIMKLSTVSFSQKSLNQCVIYNSGRNAAIGLYSNEKSMLILSATKGSDVRYEQIVGDHWRGLGMKADVEVFSLDSLYVERKSNEFPIIRFNNSDIMFYNRFRKVKNYVFCDFLDILIVGQSSHPPKDKVNIGLIVLDSTNSAKAVENWKDYAAKNNIAIRVVKEEGAAVIDL